MNLQERLKDRGIKITQHKLAILDLFCEHKHLDAPAIVELLHEKKAAASLATVYRILSSFEIHKIIIKHNFGTEHAIYELITSADEHHDHLVCVKCGQVIEFVDEQIENLQILIAKQNNFEVYSHTLNIYGYCQQCTQIKTE